MGQVLGKLFANHQPIEVDGSWYDFIYVDDKNKKVKNFMHT